MTEASDERNISTVRQSPQHSPLTGPPTPPTPTIASTPSPVSTHQQDHMTSTKCYEGEGSRDEGTSNRNRRDSSRDIGVSSSDGEMRMRLEGLEVDIGREQSAQYSSSARKNGPVSVSSLSLSLSLPLIDILLSYPQQSSFIYSTKPPSLYGGPKPSPECSSRPTTVSLMLSRGGGIEAGHTHHSALSARPRTQQGKYTSSSHTNSKKRKNKGT